MHVRVCTFSLLTFECWLTAHWLLSCSPVSVSFAALCGSSSPCLPPSFSPADKVYVYDHHSSTLPPSPYTVHHHNFIYTVHHHNFTLSTTTTLHCPPPQLYTVHHHTFTLQKERMVSVCVYVCVEGVSK